LAITDRERAGCGQYVNFNSVKNGIPITLKYFITIPMSTFNLFNKLRYLQMFFGNWTLDIISTLDNMFVKFISYNRISQPDNYHRIKQKVYQCYGIGTEVPYTTTAANAADAWIKLTPQSYKITSANVYTSQFKLIPDRYMSLVAQFSQLPLQLPFIKVISTPCGKIFAQAGDILYVIKQAASKFDSLFITVHYH
jgi:hypothetical protein